VGVEDHPPDALSEALDGLHDYFTPSWHKDMARKHRPELATNDLLSTTTQQSLASLVKHLDDIDQRLRWIDLYLHQLQPPRDGRLRIKWVVRKGVKVPSPIVWHFAKKAKLWSYRELPVANLPRRAKHNRAFHDNAKQVGELLGLAQELLLRRAESVRRLTDFRHSVRQAVRMRQGMMSAVDQLLDALDLEHADWVSGAPKEWSDEDEPLPPIE
jgi:hypothetical protein